LSARGIPSIGVMVSPFKTMSARSEWCESFMSSFCALARWETPRSTIAVADEGVRQRGSDRGIEAFRWASGDIGQRSSLGQALVCRGQEFGRYDRVWEGSKFGRRGAHSIFWVSAEEAFSPTRS